MADGYWVGREQVSNLEQYLQKLIDDCTRRRQKFGLTPRELELVSVVVAGYSVKEIAKYFYIADDTVKRSLSNVFDKLGVSTRQELALFAVTQSLPIYPI
jgi:DNA-binding NarL/FixJ family response regulator